MKKMFLISLLVALSSQVNLELLESNFVVSAGVIFYVIFLFYYEEFIPIFFGILSGTMILLLRLAVHQVLFGGVNIEVATANAPEIIFYTIYAIFFMLFLENNWEDNFGLVFVVLIICDFASNVLEVFVRYAVLEEKALIGVVPTLLVVSVIRSSVIWVALTALNYYNMMLTKKEHEERYKKLLLLTSQLKTEMYWIEKNMNNIEKVVTQSYDLYEKINNKQNNNSWSDMALNIARDVSEIKKDNGLVVRGIRDITEKELSDKGMEYKDINGILSETMIKETKRCNKDIKFEFVMGENFYTYKHYYLMTVLRNLILNSMDAIRKSQEDAKICVVHETDVQQHVFKIVDNGSGICEEYLKQIFSPGFSTKVNSETGKVNRGLGLSIVKYIIEENFNGKLELDSKSGTGTTIIISIPKSILEGLEEEVYEI